MNATMNATSNPPRIANPWLRWLLYLFLLGCGLGLFIACGVTGGYLALNWLA